VSGKTPWLVAGAAGVALVAVLFAAHPAAGAHPNPRPGITADRVLTDLAIPRTPGSVEAYAAARAAAGTLDGVYCHCDCSKHAGHRSLLTCFESEHGAHCDICMGEAVLAAQLASRGTSLQEIRVAIDARFGS
jgi:hypothetical protein